MKCPHCPVELLRTVHREVEFDRCARCGGLWFDRNEIAKFNHFDSDFPLRPEQPVFGEVTSLLCPRCVVPLSRSEYKPGGLLQVERCDRCKGVWLDGGELETIRRLVRKTLRITPARRRLEHIALQERQLWEVHQAKVASEESAISISRFEWLFMFLTRLPVEVHNPVLRFPKATLLLILANIVVFLAGGTGSIAMNYGFVPAQLRHFQNVFSLITSMFIHANIQHVAINMYFLYTFGDNVEDYFGSLNFICFYFLCGASAGLAHFAANIHSVIPAIGASGAISGILAAYMLVFPRRRIYWMILIWPLKIRALWYGIGWAALQVINAARGGGRVAWYAHLGGFAAGLVLTHGYILYKRSRPLFHKLPS